MQPKPLYDMPESRPPPIPPRGSTDRSPDRRELEDERLTSCLYHDYSGHYVSHSQFYHPERQRRHQRPEEFWYSQPHCPRPDIWQPPNPPHTSVELHKEYEAPPPMLYSLQPHSGSSHVQIDCGQPLPHPQHAPQPRPLMHCTTEKVSAVDLIRLSQADEEIGKTSHREIPAEGNWQRRLVEPAHPIPPWLQQRVNDPAMCDSGRQGREEGGTQGEVRGPPYNAESAEFARTEETKKPEEIEEWVKVEVGRERVKERGELAGEHFGEDHAVSAYESSFVAEVQKFVQRNSEMFNIITEKELTMEVVPTLHNLKSKESFKYAEPDALEYHMRVDEGTRRQCFFMLVEPGDVVRGHVVAKRHGGLTIQITSFVNSHKYRELSDLSIRGVVLLENLAENHDKCDDVMRDMQLDDVVQAVVLKVELPEEILSLSFRNDHFLEVEIEAEMLGYRDGRRPVSPRPSVVPDGDFLCQLEEDPGFSNPEAVPNLCHHLGLTTASLRPTLLRDLQTAEYAESDFAEPLRKSQRFKWSMKTVAVGVDHFKSGAHTTAVQYFNHALDIDPSNVEGLVARGALSATTGKYKEGIADFQKALSIKSTHRNARNYFVETQVVLGKELEEQGKIDSAIACYREALTLDPEEVTARERLGILTAAIEMKAAKQREREKEEEEEREKMAKLRKIIEKEKKKRLKEKKPKAKKRKTDQGHKRHKKHSETYKRHYTSSEEFTASGTEDEEGDSRTERERRESSKRKGEKRKEKHKRKQNKRSNTRSKSSRVHSSSTDEFTVSDTGSEEEEGRRERCDSSSDRRPKKRSRSLQRHYTSEEETTGAESGSTKEGKVRKTYEKVKMESQRHYSTSSKEESDVSRMNEKQKSRDKGGIVDKTTTRQDSDSSAAGEADRERREKGRSVKSGGSPPRSPEGSRRSHRRGSHDDRTQGGRENLKSPQSVSKRRDRFHSSN